LWGPIVAHGFIVLFVPAYLWRRTAGAERQWWFEYLLIFAVTLATGLLVWRSLAFVGALSAIPLGWLAARLLRAFGAAERPLRKSVIVAAMIVVLVPGFPVVVAMAAIPGNETGKLGATNSPACRFDDSATTLNALSPAKMFAPLDLGPALLLQTHHG